jgi:hypothetical protein
VNETDFWVTLEYRLCHEFKGMLDRNLRHLWCDGFIPEQYVLGGPEPCITGHAWICLGARQEQWKFTLFLPQPVASAEEIDWRSLLPPENVTGWLALNQLEKRIQIEPSAAVPDLT